MDNEAINKIINKGRMPVIVYVILVGLLTWIYSEKANFDAMTQNGEILFRVFLIVFAVYWGLPMTYKFDFSPDSLTVIWHGIFRHRFPWTRIVYAGVYLTESRVASAPIIICVRHKWMKSKYLEWFYFFFPFSAFRLSYSPKVYDELKKVCPNLEYVANRERVFEIYNQRNKK